MSTDRALRYKALDADICVSTWRPVDSHVALEEHASLAEQLPATMMVVLDLFDQHRKLIESRAVECSQDIGRGLKPIDGSTYMAYKLPVGTVAHYIRFTWGTRTGKHPLRDIGRQEITHDGQTLNLYFQDGIPVRLDMAYV